MSSLWSRLSGAVLVLLALSMFGIGNANARASYTLDVVDLTTNELVSSLAFDIRNPIRWDRAIDARRMDYCWGGPQHEPCTKVVFDINCSCAGTSDDSALIVEIPGWVTYYYYFAPNTFKTAGEYVDQTWLPRGTEAKLTVDLGSTASAVPEASSWALFVTGLVGIGSMSRRARRR